MRAVFIITHFFTGCSWKNLIIKETKIGNGKEVFHICPKCGRWLMKEIIGPPILPKYVGLTREAS